ncbi:hypothetical protein N7527_001241 [Penicillium freii]|uniref:AB hydrolase-1 domain-containing protein n=1 Tax=Penicillium freii TaxID=48697 RepID=A0A101MSN5_PENFR|nr:hypothetical protein N7527_001241 [Penicillium freii]KUM66011.1 hypothetical protein ACN42_g1061 [Penicillium freii]
MPFITTDDGQEIYFRAQGTSRPILVFVSGYFGIDNIWQPLIASLSSQYHCISYDSRGYGRSSKPASPDRYSIPRHASDLRAVLNACNANDRVVLVTHSMGCNIASAYYLAHPDHVAAIIYSAGYSDGKHLAQFLPLEVFTAGIESPRQCAAFYENMGLEEATALEASKWPAHARRNNAKALLAFDMGDRYAQIKVPGVIVIGEKDIATPMELVTPIVEQMPSCKLEVLKGIKHFPPTEAPEEMERLIQDCVKNLPK